ncbi:MAG: TetR family transcriptional regulator [Oscillospiraceae bacterium]|nr:TetR family transcriptional regulator [Oscillospiraceae bacterium]
MKRDIEKTKTALMDAAEKLMGEYDDPADVTARAITQEAGVNLAMINYCFGSRENLLFEVFERLKATAPKLDPAFIQIMSSDMSPKQKLAEVHYHSMKLMLSNYKYCRALTKHILISRRIGDKRSSMRFIQEHFGDKKTEGECRLIAFELSSIHELAVLRHQEIKEVCGIDLLDDETLKKYVYDNVNSLLGDR